MKTLLILFVLLFSSSVIAEDISDFEIEGISIGDSLLDYFSEEEIIEQIKETRYMYEYLTDEFGEVYLYKEFKYGLFIVIIIFMPTDLIPLYSDLMIGKDSFFSDYKIDINYSLGLGSILRPSLNFLLLAYISFKIFDRIKIQKKLNNKF